MKRVMFLTAILAMGGGQAMAATVPVFSYEFPASWNGTGTTLVDQSAAGNDATIVSGSVALSANVPPGQSGSSMNFAGDQTVRTNAIDLLDNPLVEANGGFTMQTWFYPTAGDLSARRKLIDYSGTEAINMENGRLTAYVSDGIRLTHSVPITADTWHEAKFVFDTGTNTIDANGDIRGDVSLTLDGVEETAANVNLTDFGDSLNRPIGLGAHPFGYDQYSGLLYNPKVDLGVAPPAPVTHEVGGDNTIGTETLDGTQGNEVRGPGLVGAKFIRVDQNRGDQLNIAEVQAFETGTGDNVALESVGSVATQSSTGWSGVASRAIDGNTDGVYGHDSVQHTNNSGYKWWQVELASAADLDSVHIWGRTDSCCNQRLDDFNLIIEDASRLQLYNEQILGVGSDPGSNRLIQLAELLSADLVASLNPHDYGAGYTYVFELGSADMIEVANPDPSIFTTYLDINNADIVVEALGPLPPGEVFQLLSADQLMGQYHSLTLPPGVFAVGDFNETGAVTTAAIPEPATLFLAGLALSGLGAYVRRRRRA